MEKLGLRERNLPIDILEDIEKVESILRKYGAIKIILYGSFARGDYRSDSDLDLGFKGIPDEKYFPALAECLMEVKRRVSVLNIDDIHGYFKERMLKEGIILYERE